ncbi:MAG: hypothetical protein ABWX96_22185 [Propionibacteriaceae bacterium]
MQQMSTPRLTFTSGPATITCDASGAVASVSHASHPGLSYLRGVLVDGLVLDGERLGPVEPEVLADVDEVEFVYTYPDRLRVVVRHTFAVGWGVRIAFSSLATSSQSVEAELRLAPSAECVAWALTLGATGAYSVSPSSGTGPLLGAQLRRGSMDEATPTGWQLTPFDLRPQGRYVVQLLWDFYAAPRAFDHEPYADAPSALVVAVGEPIQVRVDEDVAVVVPDGLELTEAADHLEVLSDAPGEFPFELRSSRGTTAFSLQWVDTVPALLAGSVAAALSRPRTAAGVVKLDGVAAALLVQHALRLNQVDDPDVAAEALDLFTARLGGGDDVDPLGAVFLAREFDRLGDPELLDVATSAVLAQHAPVPGLGLAATQLCLGLIVSNRPVDRVLGHLSEAVADPSHDLAHPGAGVASRAAALELIAVTHAGPGAGGSIEGISDVVPLIAGLGLHLGAGLKGRAVQPLPVAELSHLLTVFQLLPDGLSSRLVRLWGCSAHVLAHRAVAELVARLEHEPVGEAHAWLALALQAE